MQVSNFKYILMVTSLLVSGATPVLAEDSESGASVTFQFSGMKWTSAKTKFEGTDFDGTRKTTTLLTGDLVDSFLYATLGKWNVYFYPFLDNNGLASVSYMVRDNLELGVDIGFNSTKSENPKEEVSTDIFGGFATWSVPVGEMVLENLFLLDMSLGKSVSTDSTTGAESENKQQGTFLKYSATLVVPLAKNISYLAGLWIAAERTKFDPMDAEKNSQQFGLMLAGLRMTMD